MFHSEEAPQKCCSIMFFYKNATDVQESTQKCDFNNDAK